jgi:hypothetical protein
MSAVKWLESQLVYCWYQNEVEDWEKAKEKERNHIIRAVNYSIMHLEELRKEAIEKRVTIGEIYVERLKQKEDEGTISKETR